MRSRSLLLVSFFALFLVLDADAQGRRRAVRTPGPDCTFTLSPSFSNPVTEAGLTRASVLVLGSPGCDSWAAYSTAGWVTIDRDPATAYITVQPNDTGETRATQLTIAGQPLDIVQNADSGPISPPTLPNVMQNGSFHLDLSHWSWQTRFPNGDGVATWTSLDANGSIASGSMHMTDTTASTQAFSQSQCRQTAPGWYDYGFAVRASSRTGVRAIIALLEFDTPDCSGSYPAYSVKQVQVAEPGVWEAHTYTEYLNDDKVAVMLIIGSYARQEGVQEVWLDDVFVRPR
ncbi:MAG TPA: BACON domain-containing carbohydrate-binding protein [Thermoanaerobaculia bacterium]|nr:BACON domain-containing carbohydrate-binding protein [Thermoanaerobaculia bacterium]